MTITVAIIVLGIAAAVLIALRVPDADYDNELVADAQKDRLG